MSLSHTASYETVRLDGKTWERAPFGEAAFGYCPTCSTMLTLRELAPAAKARCANGHECWVAAAKHSPPEAR